MNFDTQITNLKNFTIIESIFEQIAHFGGEMRSVSQIPIRF